MTLDDFSRIHLFRHSRAERSGDPRIHGPVIEGIRIPMDGRIGHAGNQIKVRG